MLSSIEEFKANIVKVIKDEKVKNITEKYNTDFFAPYLNYFFEFLIKGKCTRGFLVALGYLMAQVEKNEPANLDNIIFPAISYEIFETAVLAHDDIIDKGQVRRGQKSMYVQFGNNHEGISRAICLGDFGLILSSEFVNHSNFSARLKTKAISQQAQIYLETIIGEMQDVDLTFKKSYDYDGILSMYFYKTALYSIIGPLKLGAVLGEMDNGKIESIEKIGKHLGIAFQIKDDILGIYSSQAEIGKSGSADITEGKATILASIFISKANDYDKKLFFEIYGKQDIDESKIEIIRNLFSKYQIKDEAEAILNKEILLANKQIQESDFNTKNKERLFQFAEYLINRKK